MTQEKPPTEKPTLKVGGRRRMKGGEIMWGRLEDEHPALYNAIVWGEIVMSLVSIVISIIVITGVVRG